MICTRVCTRIDVTVGCGCTRAACTRSSPGSRGALHEDLHDRSGLHEGFVCTRTDVTVGCGCTRAVSTRSSPGSRGALHEGLHNGGGLHDWGRFARGFAGLQVVCTTGLWFARLGVLCTTGVVCTRVCTRIDVTVGCGCTRAACTRSSPGSRGVLHEGLHDCRCFARAGVVCTEDCTTGG